MTQITVRDEELIKKFEEFVKNLGKDDIVGLMHHTDPDGICSGVIAAKIIERIRGKQVDFRINQKGNEFDVKDATVEAFRGAGVNKIIITDVSVDQNPEGIRKLEGFAEVLVLDHHKIYNDLNSERTIFINPTLVFDGIDSASYCTTKLIYDLGRKLVDIKDLEWVTVVGLIGDCCDRYWPEFVKKVYEKHGFEIKKDMFETELGKTASLLSEAESYDYNNVELEYEVVYNAKTYEDILGSELKRFQNEIKGELNEWLENFENRAEFHNEIEFAFYLLKPKFNIKSGLSTMLSLRNPHKTIVIIQDLGEESAYFSARRNDKKVKVNDLCEEAIKGLEKGSAGGHIPAAGGRILTKDIQRFKENLIRILKDER